MNKIDNLKRFVTNIKNTMKMQNNINIKVMRYSKNQPYWSIFIYDDIDNFIGAYHCLIEDCNLEEMINCLSINELHYKISKEYYISLSV